MGDSIFKFADKFGYESPFGDWLKKDFPRSSSKSGLSSSQSSPPGVPPVVQGDLPEILRTRYDAMQTAPWNWSGTGYSANASSSQNLDYVLGGNAVTKLGQNYYMPYWLRRPVGSKDSQDALGNPLGDIVILLGVKIQTNITQGAAYIRNNIPPWAGPPAGVAVNQLLFPGILLPGFPVIAPPPGPLGWRTPGAPPVEVIAANPTVFTYNGAGNWAGYTLVQAIEFTVTVLAYIAIRNLVQLQGLVFQMTDVTNNYIQLNILVTFVTGSLTSAQRDIINSNLEATLGGESTTNIKVNFVPVAIGAIYLTANNFEVSFPKPTSEKGLGIQSIIFR